MTSQLRMDAVTDGSGQDVPRRFLGRPIPREGQDGLFSQSWYPICRSTALEPGRAVGADFLDGRVVAYRRRDGRAQVLSGYCAHLGADLSHGEVIDDDVVCPLHRWRWSQDGRCTATGTGLLDRPPANARLFPFPTRERFGLVWAFNGISPLWDLPVLRYPDDELELYVGELGADLNIDPSVYVANAMDVQHLEALHDVTFDPKFLVDDSCFEYTEYSASVDLRGEMRGEPFHSIYGVHGTSFFTLESEIDGRWFAVVDGLALPRPGLTRAFIVGVAQRTGDVEEDRAHAKRAFQWEYDVLMEDYDVLASLHFRPGPVTRSDTHVARFYEYLRRYPRAHPSADFIV